MSVRVEVEHDLAALEVAFLVADDINVTTVRWNEKRSLKIPAKCPNPSEIEEAIRDHCRNKPKEVWGPIGAESTRRALTSFAEQLRNNCTSAPVLATIGAIVVPDALGGLEVQGTNEKRFKHWVNTYGDELRRGVSNESVLPKWLYRVRCSLVHELQATPNGTSWPVVRLDPSMTTPPEISNQFVINLPVPWLVNGIAEGIDRFVATAQEDVLSDEHGHPAWFGLVP